MNLDLQAPEGRLYVGGTWDPSLTGQELDVENPADETLIRRVASAGAGDVDHAVRVATVAAEQWQRVPWMERAQLLRVLADRIRRDARRLALIDTADSGNPWTGSQIDVEAAAAGLEYMAGLGGEIGGRTIPTPSGSLAWTRRAPYGVVGRILAFNHPLRFAAQAIAAPIMAGNAVILKPADPTPLSALELAGLTDDLLPPGLLNVLPGTGAEAGHAIAAHPGIPRIGFTGSVQTGRAVMSAGVEHIKSVTLELGGKNPLVICDDVDIWDAAQAAVRGMNLRTSNGQSCQSTSRILVHERIHEEFVAALVEQASALLVDRPEEPTTDVGPLIHGQHRARVADHVRRATADGARLCSGGGRPAGLDRGHFFEPTVLDQVTPDMAIAHDEVFGPVMAVMAWRTISEAVSLANGTDYGLTANIWTHDLGRAHSLAEQMQAGLVWINGPVARPPGTPFGGWHLSGLGKEQCLEELLGYTRETSYITAYPALGDSRPDVVTSRG